MKSGKTISFILAFALLLSLAGCAYDQAKEKPAAQAAQQDKTAAAPAAAAENTADKYKDARVIVLKETGAAIDGTEIEEFDLTWHIDPSSEKEWYEGTEPDADGAYIAHDIWYYPRLDEEGFTRERYDGETEWVYHYTADGLTDYIFSTLPCFMNDDSLPVRMMHTAEEAYENKVLHITEPGTYVLTGTWHGQILIDLGDEDETFTDENAKVTVILSDCDVTCDCAPAFMCYSAYECDNQWEEQDSHSNDVDTTDAGINVVIADGTENNFTGANVYRLLKAKYKKEGSTVQKKAHKTDAAFYSFVSMNINGEDKGTGILNITSTTFEGLDSELHLTMNGGYVNIYSQDDGINVNEDGVSVFTMNGGTLHIFAGLGNEGDCVDSNGYIVVNGGLIAAGTPSAMDSALDSDCGNTINGGKVVEVGSKGFEGMGGFGGGKPGNLGPSDMPEGFDPFDGGNRPGSNNQGGFDPFGENRPKMDGKQ